MIHDRSDVNRGSILAVDDTPNNLRLLSSILTVLGYKVRSVTEGQMAITAAQAAPPDLILLDINMPELDGFAVCQQLKRDTRTREIPIVFISALDEVADKVKAFEVGGVDYITKPFQTEEVLARVETQLALQRLKRQLVEQNTQLQTEIQERQRAEAALRSTNEELQREVQHRLAAEAALQAANQELQRLAFLDTVTQLANRLHFNNCLMQVWQRLAPKAHPLSLLLCAVDEFEAFQQTYGQAASQACLRSIADLMRASAQPSSEVIARYSSTELAILLPQPAGVALELAQAIQANIQQLALSHEASSIRPYVTLSIGVATAVPDTMLEPETLTVAAAQAVAQARGNGGDRIVPVSLP